MDSTKTMNNEPATLTGVAFVSAYVDDFEKGYEFYANVLGLEKQYDMGDHACFFKLGEEHGLYLQGSNKTTELDPITSRATFTLSVASTSSLFAKLKAANVRTVEDEPMSVGTMYWFQFYDPAGNLLEALGDK